MTGAFAQELRQPGCPRCADDDLPVQRAEHDLPSMHCTLELTATWVGLSLMRYRKLRCIRLETGRSAFPVGGYSFFRVRAAADLRDDLVDVIVPC